VEFTPNRIRVTLDPDQGQTITRSVSWSEALHGDAGALP
jgi:hypothetical protein